jgi:hypothetical protein
MASCEIAHAESIGALYRKVGILTTLQLSGAVEEMLERVEGGTPELKLLSLIRSDLENRLRCCLDRLCGFERKHGMSFGEFKDAWANDRLEHKHSHEIERDYMEWESLDDEHAMLLAELRESRGVCSR